MSGVRPTVSVIMPNLNGGRFIRPAIESVINQTWSDFELIVVDNGSTDDSMQIMGSYEIKEPRVTVLVEPTRGVSKAVNTGIDSARGKYLSFLASDDVYNSGKLEAQVNLLEKADGLALCYTDGWLIDRNGNRIGSSYYTQSPPNDNLKSREFLHALMRSNFIIGGSIMISRDGLGTERFDEELHYGEDWDFLVRLATKTRFLYISKQLYGYRIYPSNTTNDPRLTLRNCSNLGKILRKWKRSITGLTPREKAVLAVRSVVEPTAVMGLRVPIVARFSHLMRPMELMYTQFRGHSN